MKILRSWWAKAIGLILGILVGLIALNLLWALWVYPAEYVHRVLAWRELDAFDWQKFPAHPLEAASATFYFDQAPDERVGALFAALAGVDDWDAFLEANATQAFIVVQDGTVRYEKYFNATQRDSIVTSFSVAKSFASALIGVAIQEGYINSVDDTITNYLPELSARDPRFSEITIRHLLLMASGLEYTEDRFPLFNGDDPLTTYYPDQREIALENTKIVDPPGEYFLYNKYHPQLLGMILERTTGISVTQYLQIRIWDPLGMEFSGSWSVDSKTSDFEKMETGVNARAIDFAKFGQLYLNGGHWNGAQVISEAWVADSTQPVMPADYAAYYPDYFASMPGRGYYRYILTFDRPRPSIVATRKASHADITAARGWRFAPRANTQYNGTSQISEGKQGRGPQRPELDPSRHWPPAGGRRRLHSSARAAGAVHLSLVYARRTFSLRGL